MIVKEKTERRQKEKTVLSCSVFGGNLSLCLYVCAEEHANE